MSDPFLTDTSEAPSLDDLTHDERVEAMKEWFWENFEDPANETPYESREGGYQWIWGGPFDARPLAHDFMERVNHVFRHVEYRLCHRVHRFLRNQIRNPRGVIHVPVSN